MHATCATTAPLPTKCVSSCAGSVQVIAQVWQAAVAAATDPVLSSLPAFGRQRPAEAWLAQQLTGLLPALLAVAAKKQYSSCTALALSSELVLAFVLPAFDAAVGLASSSTAVNSQSPGVLLMQSVVAALDAAYTSGSVLQQCMQPMVLRMLAVLVQQPQLARPAGLEDLLCVAAEAAAAAGDACVYEVAVRQAQVLGLSDAAVTQVRLAALVGAAKAAADSNSASGVLELVWSDTLQTAAGATANGFQLSKNAAAAVVAAIAASAGVADTLLGKSALPAAVASELLQAAVNSGQAASIQRLLQHAEQHGLLQQLPPAWLRCALDHGTATAAEPSGGSPSTSSGGLAFSRQAFAVLLQSGHVPGAAAAAALLQDAGTEQQWEQLLDWLQQQCSTAPAATAHCFLCDLMLASVEKQPLQCYWQLYQLLLACQQAGSWPPAQQGLPAAKCSALINHAAQEDAGLSTAEATGRVLQLWQHFSTSRQPLALAITELGCTSQRAVTSVLVASGQNEAALQLAEQSPALLQPVATAWQQQQVHVDPRLLIEALQLAGKQDSPEAAGAAEQLLEMLEQQQPVQVWAALAGTAVQLVQLLSLHDRLAPAYQLLVGHIVGKVKPAVAAPAIAAFTQTAVRQQAIELVSQVVESQQAKQQQALLLPALELLLAGQHAAAVAVLLHILQHSTAAGQHQQLLPNLLSTQQLLQLVNLSCSSSSTDSAARSASNHTVICLPSPYNLSQQWLSSGVALPRELAALLVNTLAQQPELQPAKAAVLLGLVTEQDLAAAAAGPHDSSSKHKSSQHTEVSGLEVLQHSQVIIAQLCLSQLPEQDSGCEIEQAITEWASRLTGEAMAAALFSAWYCAQPAAGSTTSIAAGSAVASAPAASAVGELCLALYHAAKAAGKGRASMDRLQLDLALAAAADAANWDEGMVQLPQLLHYYMGPAL